MPTYVVKPAKLVHGRDEALLLDLLAVLVVKVVFHEGGADGDEFVLVALKEELAHGAVDEQGGLNDEDGCDVDQNVSKKSLKIKHHILPIQIFQTCRIMYENIVMVTCM